MKKIKCWSCDGKGEHWVNQVEYCLDCELGKSGQRCLAGAPDYDREKCPRLLVWCWRCKGTGKINPVVIKAKKITTFDAPKEWTEVKKIKGCDPFLISFSKQHPSVKLKQYKNTNLCQWYIRDRDGWEPRGPLFEVDEEWSRD
jgi:hypothetical protein